MPNRKHATEEMQETGEVSVNADREILNSTAPKVEGAEPGEARPRTQAEAVGEPVSMVKDGATLSVDLRDVEAHRRMGWGFAR